MTARVPTLWSRSSVGLSSSGSRWATTTSVLSSVASAASTAAREFGRPIDWVQRAELAQVGVRATHIET